MTILKNTILLLTLFTIVACGSSERIITDDGKVYEVKGNTIQNKGVKVTNNLSASEKAAINNRLEIKQKAQSAAEEEQKTLEKAIDEQKQIQDNAKAKQKQLEDKLEELQNALRETQKARDNYIDIRKIYNEKQKEFDELNNSGKLSPADIEAWNVKLNKLKLKVEKAQNQLKRFN